MKIWVCGTEDRLLYQIIKMVDFDKVYEIKIVLAQEETNRSKEENNTETSSIIYENIQLSLE